MSRLQRIALLRHGQTEGNSRERFHGAGDVALSREGQAEMRAAGAALAREWFDLVVASPLQRSWQGAVIVTGGSAPVRIEPEFREVHFGRWEGLTAKEIEEQDPILYREWQEGRDFVFPGGERRSDFQARVECGLARVLATGARSALLVLHKGPIRAIARKLVGEALPPGQPALAECLFLARSAAGRWHLGLRGSNPPGLG